MATAIIRRLSLAAEELRSYAIGAYVHQGATTPIPTGSEDSRLLLVIAHATGAAVNSLRVEYRLPIDPDSPLREGEEVVPEEAERSPEEEAHFHELCSRIAGQWTAGLQQADFLSDLPLRIIDVEWLATRCPYGCREARQLAEMTRPLIHRFIGYNSDVQRLGMRIADRYIEAERETCVETYSDEPRPRPRGILTDPFDFIYTDPDLREEETENDQIEDDWMEHWDEDDGGEGEDGGSGVTLAA